MSSSSSSSLSIFSLDEINDATNKFQSKILGCGGEGTVYLGHIKEKYPVAVKLLNPNSIEFENEIKTVSKIQHPNIVSLLGYCNEFNQRILVYEYMERGSLSDYVKKNSSICLSWKQRLNVCLGAARGLQYLHTATDELPKGIIHRDMKPANILLERNWVAKVSDFGMFKLSHADQTNSTMITALKGTCGYYAPEYLRFFQITRKIDVYAFGVVLFEVLCRKKPWDRGDLSYYAREDEDLGLWAKENVDTEIHGEISDDCLEIFVDIIGRSLRSNPADRPTMDEVVLDLERALVKCHEPEDHEGMRDPKPGSIVLDVDTRMTQENVDALINSITIDLLFSEGKPVVAALTIYKCLIHWKSFEDEGTIVFDRLDQMISYVLENGIGDDSMPYMLGNISTLLFLLQGYSSLPSSANLPVSDPGVICHVEPKYPALLFKQKLLAHVDKIYGSIRDSLKTEIAHLISVLQIYGTIKACQSEYEKVQRRHLELEKLDQNFKSIVVGGGNGNVRWGKVPDQSRAICFRIPYLWSDHVQTIIYSLDRLLSILKKNYVPSILVQRIFSQNFSYINLQFFNRFLLDRECCSFEHGECMKELLDKLERWCCKCTEAYAGSSWDELKHVRQAVGFLVIRKKYQISYDKIANDLCPVLSVQQLHTICTQYWYDDPTHNVASDVISTMKMLMTEDSNNAVNQSYLLDEDSSIPFSFDEISITLDENDFSDVKPAGDLVENLAFRFLKD